MRHYSQRLEQDLYHTASSAERYQISLAECQQRLTIVGDKLAEERLEHTASRTELDYERQRHRETEKLFDLTYNAAEESFELVAGLRAQIVELQTTSPIHGTLQVPQSNEPIEFPADDNSEAKT